MICLKIIDENNTIYELEDLTTIELIEVKQSCKILIEKINEEIERLENQ